MGGIYWLILVVGISCSLIFLVRNVVIKEVWNCATAVSVLVMVFVIGASGLCFEADKTYARENFVSGTYEVDTALVIENCSDKADTLALSLIDGGTNTCFIEPNISKWDLEYVCTIPKEGEDIRVYLSATEIRKMLDKEYIKLVTN